MDLNKTEKNKGGMNMNFNKLYIFLDDSTIMLNKNLQEIIFNEIYILHMVSSWNLKKMKWKINQ